MVRSAMAALEEAYALLGKVLVYASLSHAVDTADANATRMQGKAYGLFGQLQSAAAYMEPELVAIGGKALGEWMEKDSGAQALRPLL